MLATPFATRPTVFVSSGSSATLSNIVARAGWFESYTYPGQLRLYVTNASGSAFVDSNMIVSFLAIGVP